MEKLSIEQGWEGKTFQNSRKASLRAGLGGQDFSKLAKNSGSSRAGKGTISIVPLSVENESRFSA
jgi:hypothetical protein